MDISKWPLSRIMQLPDWCFGGRWWVGEYMGSTTGVAYYRLGEETLPNRFVLWGVLTCCNSPSMLQAMRVTIRLGGSKPASITEVYPLDRILEGVSISSIAYELYVNQNGLTWIGNIRQFVEPSGRKLVLVANGDQAIAYEMTIGLLISAVPTEVPDWLVK